MTLIEILESRKEALTVLQVAELLGVSAKKVYHLAAVGVLPAFRIGKAVRFDAQDLADWLRKKKPSDEQLGARKPQKEGDLRSDRKGQEAGPSHHIWRRKVKSLEAVLATDSLGESNSARNS